MAGEILKDFWMRQDRQETGIEILGGLGVSKIFVRTTKCEYFKLLSIRVGHCRTVVVEVEHSRLKIVFFVWFQVSLRRSGQASAVGYYQATLSAAATLKPVQAS